MCTYNYGNSRNGENANSVVKLRCFLNGQFKRLHFETASISLEYAAKALHMPIEPLLTLN